CPGVLGVALVVASVSMPGCQVAPFQQGSAETELLPSDPGPETDGDGTLDHALSLAAAQRHSDAREVLDPLLQREPENSRARVLHGVLRAHEGRVGDAMEVFEALRRDHPDMSEPYVNLAVLYAVEGRLDDARKILLATLERQPDAVAYASLRDVYMKLAHEAGERARELEAGVVTASNQGKPRVSEASQTAAESAEAGPGETDMQAEQSVVEPHRVASQPQVPVQPRPGAADESVTAPPKTLSAAMPWTTAADSLATDSQSEDVRGATAETVAAVPDVFCANAEGFSSRRDVAEAALWLQSFGADVIGVRREERRTPNSYRVFLPPLESRRQANAKLREIHNQGVRDVAVIPSGDLANGISFGVYSDMDNVHQRVAELERFGHTVRSRIAGEDIIGEYVIDASVNGAPNALDAAWASQFPDRSIRVVDCG
ncbi:MAG: tetratricopeptide repeat protein, partial [Acidobacteria bacterium]|nr:tetratricopeptide repeat protein [Acidobacteriota bacterium]